MKKTIIILFAIICLVISSGCCKPIVEKEYIQVTIPDIPADPEFYPVTWGTIRCPVYDEKQTCFYYYLDEKNAKNLLKDWELNRSQTEDLKTILKGLNRR